MHFVKYLWAEVSFKKVSGTKFYHIFTHTDTYIQSIPRNKCSLNFHITNAYSLILTIPNLRTNNKSQVLLKSTNYMHRGNSFIYEMQKLVD